MVTFDPRAARQGLVFQLQLARFAALVSDMEKIKEGACMDRLGADAPLLDRWVFAERPAACLMGQSTGHPVLEGTGSLITTSDLVLISDDRASARTLSRWYRLGDPYWPTDPDSGGSSSWQ